MGSRALVAAAIIFAALVAAWMLRYEGTKQMGIHRNRITNVRCYVEDECWFKSDWRVP
jgi:hypothetical protein